MMGIDQPTVSPLFNGRLANSSSARLMRFLTTLGQDVEIVVKAKPRTRARPHPGHCRCDGVRAPSVTRKFHSDPESSHYGHAAAPVRALGRRHA
jgi:hypothetical protein